MHDKTILHRPSSLLSKTIWMFALLTSMNMLNAQNESCSQKLVDAQEIFARGQIELVPDILESCLQKGFNRQEKVAAYRLLTLCHLYYNRTVEASQTMQNLLSLQPEYKIQDIDPSEFINLHSTFRTTPLFIIGLKGSIGAFNFYETRNYNDINSSDYSGKYSRVLSLTGGLSIEVPIIEELSIVTEVFYNTYEYNFNRTVLNYSNISFSEQVSGIEIPLLAQWNILKNKQVIPYFNIGTSIYYVLSSEGTINREDSHTGEPDRRASLGSSIDLISTRNRFNYALTAGTGLRIKGVLGKGYITMDIRYSRYFKNNIEENNRAEIATLTYSYLYTDNSLKTENIQFLIGYKFPIYFPKQRKSSRPEQ